MHPGVKALVDTHCQCGAKKDRGKSFCSACYFSLPERLRGQLYNRAGRGYEHAYERAVAILKG